MIRTILWDIDGTLLNFLEAEKAAIRACFASCSLGECSDEMLKAYSAINVKYWEALERGEMTKPQILVGRFVEFFRLYGLDTTVAPAFNSEYQVRLGDTVCFFPQAVETLQALRGRVTQCAVTNGTAVAQHRKLRNSGLERVFDHVFISEEVGFEKPNRAFFEEVFRVTGCRPEETLIVGDSLTSDIRGGNNAGIRTCWYNPGGKPNDRGVHVDYEIRGLAEVLTLPGI